MFDWGENCNNRKTEWIMTKFSFFCRPIFLNLLGKAGENSECDSNDLWHLKTGRETTFKHTLTWMTFHFHMESHSVRSQNKQVHYASFHQGYKSLVSWTPVATIKLAQWLFRSLTPLIVFWPAQSHFPLGMLNLKACANYLWEERAVGTIINFNSKEHHS